MVAGKGQESRSRCCWGERAVAGTRQEGHYDDFHMKKFCKNIQELLTNFSGFIFIILLYEKLRLITEPSV